VPANPITLDPLIYAELRRLAGRVHRGRPGSLQPTALLHEAWMKLDKSEAKFETREHFLAVASMAMRQILVNRARANATQKRGGDVRSTTLAEVAVSDGAVDLIDLDDALIALQEVDATAAQVVLMRTFGGLTEREIAVVLQTSHRTVARSWRYAKAFLKQRLTDE
jgi:RNA polymerase sigma factor (TIGR02999 family)